MFDLDLPNLCMLVALIALAIFSVRVRACHEVRTAFLEEDGLWPRHYRALPSMREMVWRPKHWMRWTKLQWLVFTNNRRKVFEARAATKPRIYKAPFAGWHCIRQIYAYRGSGRHPQRLTEAHASGGYQGWGTTPQAAYENWLYEGDAENAPFRIEKKDVI